MTHDLGVISRTVEAYQRVLARIGDTVYVDGKMGAGQFHQKVQIS